MAKPNAPNVWQSWKKGLIILAMRLLHLLVPQACTKNDE
jgi:hypothetical protein